MTLRVVALPTALYLVPSAKTDTMIRERVRDHPGMPASLDQIVAELNARSDGAAATFSPPRKTDGSWSLQVYGRTWILRLFPTNRNGGYMIASIDPLRVRDHHRLAQGCLLVRPFSWQRVFEVRQLPPGADSQWNRLRAEWIQLSQEKVVREGGAPAVSLEHTRFLDTVDRLIDANEKITTAAARIERPYSYRAVNPIGERRYSTSAIYDFVVTGGRVPEQDTFVQVRGEPEQRGQVTRVAGGVVTVRFDQPIDFARIEQTGELVVTPSTIVFDKQREAVAVLRDGQSRNRALLTVFVDHRVRRMQAHPDEPSEVLDEDQLSAFCKALAVEDLLLVLGPPGTGKTRMISQVARAAAIGGRSRAPQRVLVTSHTNRAVDNVLARLPADLTVVRVGNEGVVTEEGLPYLLERQAGELRKTILNTTRRTLESFGDLDVAAKWATELDDRIDHAPRGHRRGTAGPRATGRRPAVGRWCHTVQSRWPDGREPQADRETRPRGAVRGTAHSVARPTVRCVGPPVRPAVGDCAGEVDAADRGAGAGTARSWARGTGARRGHPRRARGAYSAGRGRGDRAAGSARRARTR